MIFSNTLTHWYLKYKRDLPWRNTKNPYHIWLSEIILQQTRVDQGMSYYLKFIKEFPKVEDLANTSEQKVLKLWQGLGYYSRARNLHYSAKYIVNELNGVFPNTFHDILKLKGVGDYTASAISSICFDEPTAVVDGNVYRVLSRYFGITTPINSSGGIKEFKALAQCLINPKNPATHNQAIMEFGAILCKPKNPSCESCPLNNSCIALQKKAISKLPVKLNKVKIKKRFFNYLVIVSADGKTILNQREGKGIWQNLYEFPLIESDRKISKSELMSQKIFQDLFSKKKEIRINCYNENEKVHKLSHQHLYSTFWIIKLNENLIDGVDWNSIHDFPVPILIHNFVEESKRTDIFSIFE